MTNKESKPSAPLNRKFKVRPQLLAPLDELATDVTELVNQAVRELLEREELWPPKLKDQSQ